MATTIATFKKNIDAGSPLDITEALTPQDLIRYTVPTGGPFSTGAPQSKTLTEGQDILLSPLAAIAANTLSDPLTIADVLLFKEVSESQGSGDFAQHSSLSAKDDYLAFSENLGDLTITDSDVLLGVSPRLKASHIVAGQGAGDGIALPAGTNRIAFRVRNTTTDEWSIGTVATGQVFHRKLMLSTGALAASAVAADAGSASITVEGHEVKDGETCFTLVVENPVASAFRLGAYALDAVPTWEADVTWLLETETTSGLTTLSIASSDVILTPTTFDLDYTSIKGGVIDTEVYSPGHDITFGVPTFPTGADDRAIRHRVFINANTTDIDVNFTPSGWKKFGSSNDAETLTIPAGTNRTLEFTHSLASDLGYVRVIGAAVEGLATYTSALSGGFIYLPEEDAANNIFEINGQTLVGGVANYPALAAKWPGWVSGTDIVLPNWRGRAMMATGALGITGAAGTTYADATAQNGLNFRTHIGGSGGSTNGGLDRSSLWGGNQTTTAGGNQSNLTRRVSEDAQTRPNAVGLVLCVIAGDLSVQTVDQPTPTSMVIQTVAGNQSGNGLTANGVYRSNNSGALQNVGFGNWTWRVKVTRIGEWIQQHYWNDTGNIAYRESYNGGSSWTAWGN